MSIFPILPHIITIEEPIEYLHTNINSVILQRDVGKDTKSFSVALKYALRHDPDVIVIGEMRDLQTISTAITAAETGHLVMGTLHTIDAAQTVDRIVEVFPSDQQAQIRLQLAQVLLAVLSQTLVPCIGGGRVPACEIMIANSAIRNSIREGQMYQIPTIIQLGQRDGMRTLNQALAEFVKKGTISEEEAILRSSNVEQLQKMLENRKKVGAAQNTYT